MKPSQRLAAADIVLPDVAVPVGSYVPAKCVGETVYVSGQLAFVNGSILTPGVLGRDVSTEQGVAAARAAALNCLAAAAQAVGGVDSLTGVCAVTGYLACVPDFDGMSAVLNGASDLFPLVFEGAGVHTRTNVGAPWLPLGSPVEISVQFSTS